LPERGATEQHVTVESADKVGWKLPIERLIVANVKGAERKRRATDLLEQDRIAEAEEFLLSASLDDPVRSIAGPTPSSLPIQSTAGRSGRGGLDNRTGCQPIVLRKIDHTDGWMRPSAFGWRDGGGPVADRWFVADALGLVALLNSLVTARRQKTGRHNCVRRPDHVPGQSPVRLSPGS
jgi:hypothetical protein